MRCRLVCAASISFGHAARAAPSRIGVFLMVPMQACGTVHHRQHTFDLVLYVVLPDCWRKKTSGATKACRRRVMRSAQHPANIQPRPRTARNPSDASPSRTAAMNRAPAPVTGARARPDLDPGEHRDAWPTISGVISDRRQPTRSGRPGATSRRLRGARCGSRHRRALRRPSRSA